MVFPLKHLDLVGTGRRLHCGREKQKSRDPCVCKHFGHVTANHSRPLQSVYTLKLCGNSHSYLKSNFG